MLEQKKDFIKIGFIAIKGLIALNCIIPGLYLILSGGNAEMHISDELKLIAFFSCIVPAVLQWFSVKIAIVYFFIEALVLLIYFISTGAFELGIILAAFPLIFAVLLSLGYYFTEKLKPNE